MERKSDEEVPRPAKEPEPVERRHPSSTHGELPSRRDLGDALVTAARKLFEKIFHLCSCAPAELNNSRLKRIAFRRCLIETRACCHDDSRPGIALDLQEQRQPFGGDFWIWQNIFDACQLGFREEQRARLPVEQAFIKCFLRVNAGAEDPHRGVERSLFVEQ